MLLFMIILAGSSQSSLKMRIKLGKQSVEKAKIELGGLVSSNLSNLLIYYFGCALF